MLLINNNHYVTVEIPAPSNQRYQAKSIDVYIADSKHSESFPSLVANPYWKRLLFLIQKLFLEPDQQMNLTDCFIEDKIDDNTFNMIVSKCNSKTPTGVFDQKNDFDCGVYCMQRMHQLVSNECMSILEMGTKPVHDNYKLGSARSYRVMMLNNLICFNEILSGEVNFISDDDSDTIFEIPDDDEETTKQKPIKYTTLMAKSCQFIGYPYTLSTKRIPHCSWYDITDNIPQPSASKSTNNKKTTIKKKTTKQSIKSSLREDDDSQSESLLMLEQLHENNEELTDSQQVNQAINE